MVSLLTFSVFKIIYIVVKNKFVLNINNEGVSWKHDPTCIPYPLLVREPLQQQSFLSKLPEKSAVVIAFPASYCAKKHMRFLGRPYTQMVPDDVMRITLQDILTRGGHRVVGYMVDDVRLVHGLSTLVGGVVWGLGSVIAVIACVFCAYVPVSQTDTPVRHDRVAAPRVSWVLLQKITACPCAIALLEMRPASGRIRAYVPLTNKAVFAQYMSQFQSYKGMGWSHRVSHKTATAIVWEADWVLK